MRGTPKNSINFPAGLLIENFWETGYCKTLLSQLDNAQWVPALVAKYAGNDYQGTVHDKRISTAEVTKAFQFNEKIFDVLSLHEQLTELIYERFKVSIDKFSSYGISRYPVGSKLSAHSDTGVYNTNRLFTCIFYLSSAQDGGNLYFPEINYQISVKSGMAVFFYSELKHEVSEIKSGDRVALIMFAES